MRTTEKHTISNCPVCDNTRLYYLFSVDTYRLVECIDCGLLLLNPQPAAQALSDIYGKNYIIDSGQRHEWSHASELTKATAENYFELLSHYRGEKKGALLEIGCGHGDLLQAAIAFGFEVTGVELSYHACQIIKKKIGAAGDIICGDINSIREDGKKFDVCILADSIEHVRDPRLFLRQIRALLKTDGVIFIATPSTSSFTARLLKSKWMEFKPEHLFYFNPKTIKSLLFHCDFERIVTLPGKKTMSMDYIAEHFSRFPVPVISGLVKTFMRLLPSFFHKKPFQTVPSGIVIMAHAAPQKSRKVLSIIIPAFNEAATLESLLLKLLAKPFPDYDTEIVIVESNSADGTREIVMKYADHPRIKVILEEQPRGKGHAVRTGFKHITGDFVLIQDADLEYDLDDYEALLEPLLSGREAFVLGSRHGGRTWKIRHFEGNPFTTFFLNFGHKLFAALVNLFYNLSLQDPFTMFKVFRRDCLYGLTFECNRFDFDYELLIKLVRKGYRPLEIPVNYNSRSFKEGKKVSILRDPWTWIRAIVKYRFQKIDLLKMR